MIILPAVYHSGYNIDTNVTEGRNFICPLWAEQYENHVACDCGYRLATYYKSNNVL